MAMATRSSLIFFFQAEDGIRDVAVTGVQTCALPICPTGAPNFLAKLTRYVAIFFAILCIILSKITAEKQTSALDDVGTSAIPAIPVTEIGRASCRERV